MTAKEVLEEISGDEREKELAFQRLMYKMDQEAIEAAGYDRGMEIGIERGIEKGIQQGIEQGIQQGIQKGIEKGKEDIAKKMIQQNIPIETIIECAGLTKEEIEKIK